MIHVLEIPSWYKCGKHPFSATYNEDHARMLQNGGLKVGVLFPNFTGSFKKRIKGDKNKSFFYLDKNIPTTEVILSSYVPFVSKINYDLLFNFFDKCYTKYVEQYGKPDIIHAHHCFMGGYFAMRLKQKYNTKFVLTKLSTPFIFEHEKLTSFEKRLIPKIISEANAVIFISKYQKEKMYELYALKKNNSIHKVIYLALNDVFLKSEITDLKKQDELIRFINIGNLIPTKNQELLIKAFSDFQKEKPNSELKIYGKGPLKSHLEELILKLNLKDKVILMGEVNREEIRNAIANSNFLISSSKRETMGVNIVEAHSQGVPVIALNAGTTFELITEHNGIHVLNETPVGLYKAMMEATQKEYDHSLIKEECLNKFSSNIIFKHTIELYKNLLIE